MGHALPQVEGHMPSELEVMSKDFYSGFQAASRDYETKYRPRVTNFTDTGLTMIFIRITSESNRSDLWKTGYQAGLFAALYGIPYCWAMGETESILQYRLNHADKEGIVRQQ